MNKNIACGKRKKKMIVEFKFFPFKNAQRSFFKGGAGQKEKIKRLSILESKMLIRIRSIYLLFMELFISGSKTQNVRGNLSTLE